jgi:hypothetical protein
MTTTVLIICMLLVSVLHETPFEDAIEVFVFVQHNVYK